MTTIVISLLALASVWGLGQWLRGRGSSDSRGVMSQQWMAEQRLARGADPQR